MEVRTPTTADLQSELDNDLVFGISEVPEGVKKRLRELTLITEGITLGRDWEGLIFGITDSDNAQVDTLYFTDEGRIAHGGVNQPRYFDDVESLLENDNVEMFGAAR